MVHAMNRPTPQTKRLPRTIAARVGVACLALGLADAGCGTAADRIEAFKTGRSQTHATADLKRGMNFGDAMEAPNEGEWGWSLSAADFKVVHEAGFDHVRVPMRISSHASATPPYAIDRAFLRRMDWAIDQALSNDLAIIVDLHHYIPMMKAPKAHADRLVGLWRQIATRYRGMPRAVVYEILNEPTDKLTAEVWNPILARAVAAIRQIDPDRLIIVEGAHWASAKDLRDTLQVPAGDPNLIASFHMYAPMYFTHQGFSWMEPWYQTRGVTFPGPPPRPTRSPKGTTSSSATTASRRPPTRADRPPSSSRWRWPRCSPSEQGCASTSASSAQASTETSSRVATGSAPRAPRPKNAALAGATGTIAETLPL